MARERWGSKIGVVLAVAGSAIGLGNFLRFPGMAASNGGGAFMIPYFVALFLVGLPLMWIEWTIGRFGGGLEHSTAPGMFHTMWSKNRFIKYFGVIGIFGPMVIFIYYSYIESWLLGYTVFGASGKYAACNSRESMEAFLDGYRGLTRNEHFTGIGWAYLFFLLTFLANIGVVFFGIRRGIQKVCQWAMPVLLILAVVLVVRVFTLGAPVADKPENNVNQGLGFLWNPDWSKLWNSQAWEQVRQSTPLSWPWISGLAESINAKVWLKASGQIFFTLSVGIGVILTYASYLTKKDDVALSGLTAASANEFAEVVLGGSIVIPAAFAFFGHGETVAAAARGTFELGFITMPLVLQKLAFGQVFTVAWFGLLFIAGITSSISLAQPAVAFLEDEFRLTKKEATLIFALVTFVLCHLVIFGLGSGVLDEFDFWGGTLCLVLFATIETILFGWVFGMDKAWTELHVGSDITIPRFYRFIIKYVTPVFLLIILAAYFIQDGLPLLQLRGVKAENLPSIIGARVVLVLMFVLLCVLVWIAWKRRSMMEPPTVEEHSP